MEFAVFFQDDRDLYVHPAPCFQNRGGKTTSLSDAAPSRAAYCPFTRLSTPLSSDYLKVLILEEKRLRKAGQHVPLFLYSLCSLPNRCF